MFIEFVINLMFKFFMKNFIEYEIKVWVDSSVGMCYKKKGKN